MTQTFTLSALTNMLSDAMSMYKDDCNSSPGNYFYKEIKSFHFENRCINLKKSVLHREEADSRLPEPIAARNTAFIRVNLTSELPDD